MLARSKLNSIERNYEELKQRIRMLKSNISDTEKVNLVDEVKKVGIDKAIKSNEFINNSLKSKI